MKHINMIPVDRIIRLIIASVFIALYLGNIVKGALGIILIMIAVVASATALVNYCPLYTMFGIHRWEKRNE